jgi:hypothetical protein
MTIETDPAQIASGGKAGVINGGSQTATSVNDPGQLDILAVKAGTTLNLSNVVITGALQPSNAAVWVGGGTAVINQSLISSNSSAGVDTEAGGVATITNSTITQSNGADGIVDNGAVNLNQDTIAYNGGWGINNHGGGSANVFNTIIAGNTTGGCFFAITAANGSGSNSDDSGTTCGTLITTGGAQLTGNGVITGTSPTNNLGPTNTFALPAGSVAINHGTGAGAVNVDQRGFLRKGNPAPGDDIGAFESGGTAPATLVVIKHVVGPGSAGQFTMTVTGASANPTSFPGAESPGTNVTVASGQTYQISESGPTANYTAVQTGNCVGPIAAGATGTCTVTNTAKPTQLTVIKHVVNTGCAANCGSAADFTITVTDTTTNTPVATFTGAESPGSPPVAITAGDSYKVTEQADAAQTGKYAPTNPDPNCSGTATANGAVTCTLTNTFITCPQPTNSGQQPAPGPPGSSSNTCVNVNVAATIQVTSAASLNAGTLAVGQSSPALSPNVRVDSNDPSGYQLTVTRTAFSSPTDIPMSISSAPVSAPMAFLAPFTGASALVPTSGNLNLGSSTSFTPNSGDNWPFSIVVGPVPNGVPAGAHQSVVTFTAVGI